MFPTVNGTVMDARSVRHSFISLPSAAGTPIEDIARLVGHSRSTVTETVYRQQIQPLMEKGCHCH